MPNFYSLRSALYASKLGENWPQNSKMKNSKKYSEGRKSFAPVWLFHCYYCQPFVYTIVILMERVNVYEDDDDHLIANQRVMLKSSGARAGTEYKDRIQKVEP